MHPRLMIALAVATLGFLATGCGGDDADGGSSAEGGSAAVAVATSSLSKPQFVEQANAICEDERQRLPQRTERFVAQNPDTAPSTPKGYTRGVKAVIIPTLESEIEKISELGAPAGEEEQVEAMLTVQRAAVDEVAEGGTFSSSEEVAEHFEQAASAMRKYGINRCALVSEPYRAAAGLPESK